MTVRENVATGGHCRTRAGFLDDAFRLPWVWREESRLQRRVEEILTFLNLLTVAERRVGDLPFGVQKRVDLGRALATEPRILLLDEPAAGLNHEEVDTLRSMIRSLRDRRGKTVLLVEHHMNLVMSVSDHVVALDFGRKIADGRPDQVQSHPDVVRAYLGTAA
jgi:branched-chain amino acid transport system ATP-binding protein